LFYRERVQNLDELVVDERGPGGAHKQAAHVMLTMYHEAERWRAAVAASALKAGVEERRLRMAEGAARDLFDALMKGMAAAQLTEEQVEVIRRVIAEQLRRRSSVHPPLAGS
jgi:hypothetical protein